MRMELSRSLVLVEFRSDKAGFASSKLHSEESDRKTHVERRGAPWSADERTSPVPGSQEVGLPFCLNVYGSGGDDVDVGMAEIFKRCPQLSEGAGLDCLRVRTRLTKSPPPRQVALILDV